MKSSNSYLIIAMLAALLAMMPAQAQTCIQGDCKGGEGVLRVDNHNTHTYYVGSFNRKSKLNGKGFEMRWDINDLSREVELLSALTGGIPSPDTLWHLKPFYIRSGEFKNGKLEGQGVFMVRNQNYFKDLLWAAKQWLPKAELTCFRYEGNFVNSEPQPSGVVYMIAPQDTIICASDQLWPPESAKRYSDIVLPNEMVIDVRRHTALNSELIRGNFLYYKLNEKEGHKLHGWAIVHRTNPFEPKGHFYRQLWSYGEKLYEDDGDAYPFDMADPKTLILEDGGKITGPVKDGKVNGFGTIEWGVNNK